HPGSGSAVPLALKPLTGVPSTGVLAAEWHVSFAGGGGVHVGGTTGPRFSRNDKLFALAPMFETRCHAPAAPVVEMVRTKNVLSSSGFDGSSGTVPHKNVPCL